MWIHSISHDVHLKLWHNIVPSGYMFFENLLTFIPEGGQNDRLTKYSFVKNYFFIFGFRFETLLVVNSEELAEGGLMLWLLALVTCDKGHSTCDT